MTNRIVVGLNFATKAALTVAGIAAVAAPIAIGILNAPTAQAQSRVQSSAARPSFEVASIRTCKPGDSVTTGRGGSGRGGGAGRNQWRVSRTLARAVRNCSESHPLGLSFISG